MQTLIRQKPPEKPAKPGPAPAEQSIGIRICALSMVLLLILASCSYVATPPAFIFIYAMVAIGGSYISYIFRNSRPRWVAILPTLGTLLLCANFVFELYYAITSAAMAQPAVTAFVHMLAGLLALHTFDLRSRTDFSISALIGLGLLTFLTGVAKDMIFGGYVVIYSILGGALLFYDSSSRSHEIGPSRAVAEAPVAGQPMIRRLRVASLGAMLPIFCIPVVMVATCLVLPKGESMLELVFDGFRSSFPLSASMSGHLSHGGRSQSVKGGAPTGKTDPGASYSAQGGSGPGTASSAGPTDPKSKGTGGGGNAAGNGSNGIGTGSGAGGGKEGKSKSGSAIPGFNGKKPVDFDPGDIKMQEYLAKEKTLNDKYEKEMVDLRSAASNLETVVLKVGSQNPTFTRRYTLNYFDGDVWTRTLIVPSKAIDPTAKLGHDLTTSNAVYVPPDLPTEEVTQEFRCEVPMGYSVPNTWLPQIVKIDDQQIRIDSDGTIKTLKPLEASTHYTVTSQVPVYDLEVMRRLPPETLYQLDEDREDELKTAKACQQLPADLNPKIKDMGADAAGIEGNWFSKAERIAEYVRAHYHYDKGTFYQAPPGSAQTDSTQTSSPQADSPSTNSPSTNSSTVAESLANRASADKNLQAHGPGQATVKKRNGPTDLEKFLFEKKVGNCRHFASAFCVLCRTQGIPARMVVGFIPGELNKKTGYREIKGKDTHVWAEIYIPYWNWVPFDPIPGGQLPAHQEGGNILTKFIGSGLANPFGQNAGHSPHKRQALPMPPPDPNKKPGDKGADQGMGFDNKNKPKGSTFTLPGLGTIDQSQIQSLLKLLGVGLLLVVLAAAVWIYLKQQKTAKQKLLLGDHLPSTVLFLEVLGELKRYDFVKQPTETADELSERARSQFAGLNKGGRPVPRELPEVVSEFMELYSADRFGGTDNIDDLQYLYERIKELSAVKARR